MARYTGPKFKLSRREGVNVTGTTSPRLEQVLSVPHGGRLRRLKQSDYGVRLCAKQRVQRQYGVLEKPFRGTLAENCLRTLRRKLNCTLGQASACFSKWNAH